MKQAGREEGGGGGEQEHLYKLKDRRSDMGKHPMGFSCFFSSLVWLLPLDRWSGSPLTPIIRVWTVLDVTFLSHTHL